MSQISFNIYNILILIGCVQGILFSLVLLKNNSFGGRSSNAYLSLFILSFSLSNIRSVLWDVQLASKYYWIYFLPLHWVLLIPFAFYFFVECLIRPADHQKNKFYFLLSPFLIHFTLQWIVFFLRLFDSSWLFHHFEIYRIANISTEIFSIVFAAVIITVVLIRITRYQIRLKDNFSSIDGRTLDWLRNLVIALVVLWGLWSIPYAYEVWTGQFKQWHHYPLWIGMSIVVYWIGYSAYSRSDVFRAPVFLEHLSRPLTQLSEKTDDHYERLLECMKIERPFLDPDLSLETLARKVDLSAGYLSQIINKKEGASFYDFINRYRVEEAKNILSDSAFHHYSILAIGMEAGFNSKSTFNTAFKKHAGLTPSAFKRELNPAHLKFDTAS